MLRTPLIISYIYIYLLFRRWKEQRRKPPKPIPTSAVAAQPALIGYRLTVLGAGGANSITPRLCLTFDNLVSPLWASCGGSHPCGNRDRPAALSVPL